MDTSIFKYGELPDFKKFTPENISKQFPAVLEKITEDFKKIEINLSLTFIYSILAPKFFNKCKKFGKDDLIEILSFILNLPPRVKAATHDIINTL